MGIHSCICLGVRIPHLARATAKMQRWLLVRGWKGGKHPTFLHHLCPQGTDGLRV